MNIRTILVPTDFSPHAQRAFQVAVSLARQLGAELHLLHVQNEGSLRTAIREVLLRADSTDEELRTAVEQLNKERMAEMLGCADLTGLAVVHLTRRGDSEHVILAYAKEINADLLAIGRRGNSVVDKLRSRVLGSVAEILVEKSPCPVVVVRREHAVDWNGT